MLQAGRVAWRLRAWLGIVPRAGSAGCHCAAGPGWWIPAWHAARARARGAGAAPALQVESFARSRPMFLCALTACVGCVAAQCRVAEQHTQGGVLSIAGRRRTRVRAKLAICAHAQVAPLRFPTSFLCGRSGWRGRLLARRKATAICTKHTV